MIWGKFQKVEGLKEAMTGVRGPNMMVDHRRWLSASWRSNDGRVLSCAHCIRWRTRCSLMTSSSCFLSPVYLGIIATSVAKQIIKCLFVFVFVDLPADRKSASDLLGY